MVRVRFSAAFLDRDGTIIRDLGYLSDPAGVELLPGADRAVALLNAHAIPVILVTNQSGIGRGLYTEADFWAVEREMERRLALRGCAVDDVRFCPHHPAGGPECECRKPGLGLYRRVAEERGILLSEALFVGDRPRDVLPAVRSGGTGILVRTGRAYAPSDVPPGVREAEDLQSAVRLALGIRAGESPDESEEMGRV